MNKCDFCSIPFPQRTYHTADNSVVRMQAFVESGRKIGPDQQFTPDWEACNECGDLIDAGNWKGLQERAMRWMKNWGVPADDTTKTFISSLYGELEKAGLVRTR
jgi:hypothetical protein